jgi:hypothetical protein
MRTQPLVIASIYPLSLSEERPGFIPKSTFALAAAAPGEVSYCEVPDCEIREYVGNDRTIRTADKTTAEKAAADLVRCWTQNYPGVLDPDKASPGIMLIRGQTIEPDELEALQVKQTAFARTVVVEADVHHSKGRPDLITSRHHKMAEWLKVTGRPWQEKLDRAATKACPFCGASNVAAASKCANCREIIDQARYQAITAAIRDGRAAEVETAMQRVANQEDATVESLSKSDVDELLKASGIQTGKKR